MRKTIIGMLAHALCAATLLPPVVCLAGAASGEFAVTATFVSRHELAEHHADAADLIQHMAEDANQAGGRTTYYPSPAGLIEVLWPGYAVAYIRSTALCRAINHYAPAVAPPPMTPEAVFSCNERDLRVLYVSP
jgi:hypothetical protein